MPRPKKPAGIPEWEPWRPPAWENADAAAIQATAHGRASPEQQQRAIQYIVNVLSGTYDGSFRPGPDGDRVTAFAEGRRFVGLQVVKLTNINLAAFRDKPSEQG